MHKQILTICMHECVYTCQVVVLAVDLCVIPQRIRQVNGDASVAVYSLCMRRKLCASSMPDASQHTIECEQAYLR